ncbi:curli-like amyloid fiber formation chaperone CsgH [Cribrihabitans sp. XS_ASV171]
MRKPISLVTAAIIGATPLSAETALAEIHVTPNDTGVTNEGIVVGLSEGEVDGSLTIEKDGPSGTSRLRQGRTVTVSRGSREVIGRTGLSLKPGAELSVTMTVMLDGIEIAEARSRFGPRTEN